MLNREINTAGWVKKEAACYTVTFSFHFLLQGKDPVTLEETLINPPRASRWRQRGGKMSFEQEERCSRTPEPDLTARLNSDRELSSGLTPVLDECIIKLDQKYQSGEHIILFV